jgi:hypothetical protein
MDIWSAIRELNEAQASLDKAMGSQGYVQPWSYVGDVNLYHGGTAVRVDRSGGYADVVEMSDLDSAIGQEGCVILERGSVVLTGGLRKRRYLRSALESFGWKASDLLQFDRADRANELARALWTYGMRDIEPVAVIRYADGDSDDDEIMGRGYMEVDEIVDSADALVPRFMEELS